MINCTILTVYCYQSDIVKRIKKISPVSSQEAGDDGMSAVMYAASALPFRGGSHQVFIHITCDACNVDTPVSLAEVNAFLNERGIAYHHMPMNSIATTSRSKKVSQQVFIYIKYLTKLMFY